MQERTKERRNAGSVDVIGMVILLLVAYRSVPVLVLGLLPLVSAGVAGLAAVGMIFGTVHGITLAFGFTLIGVAQDYPIHLFSHQHRGLDARSSVRALWPTLATGVASTCVAYLAFLFSASAVWPSLIFTVTGLAVAGLTTRFFLPPLVPDSSRDAADSALLGRLWHAIAALPRPLGLGVATAIACVAYLAFSPRPLWENDLGALTPIPPALLARDSVLRTELGAPDVRHLLVIEDTDAESVLETAANLDPKLAALVARGLLDGYDQLAAIFRPGRSRSSVVLPCRSDRLRAAPNEALGTTPFKPGIFEPFLADVEPLAASRARPAGPRRITARVTRRIAATGAWRSLDGPLALAGVKDAAALAEVAAQEPGTTLLDLKQASRTSSRTSASASCGAWLFPTVLLVIVVFVALATPRVRRVLAPMALTTLIIVALFHAAGLSLSLFHLIAGAGGRARTRLRALLRTRRRGPGRTATHAARRHRLLDVDPPGVRPARALNPASAARHRYHRGRGCGEQLRAGIAADTPPFPDRRLMAVDERIAALIPHAGTMCLLERIEHWDDSSVSVATTTHRNPTHPLASPSGLRAIHLCEYGAQAMALRQRSPRAASVDDPGCCGVSPGMRSPRLRPRTSVSHWSRRDVFTTAAHCGSTRSAAHDTGATGSGVARRFPWRLVPAVARIAQAAESISSRPSPRRRTVEQRKHGPRRGPHDRRGRSHRSPVPAA
jgi:hypothetical protein